MLQKDFVQQKWMALIGKTNIVAIFPQEDSWFLFKVDSQPDRVYLGVVTTIKKWSEDMAKTIDHISSIPNPVMIMSPSLTIICDEKTTAKKMKQINDYCMSRSTLVHFALNDRMIHYWKGEEMSFPYNRIKS